MKKLISILLGIGLIVGISACKPADTKKTDEKVTLKWVMPGPGNQQDAVTVWEEFNKKIKTYPGLENVSVEFVVFPLPEYKQKFMLMQSSGEKMDILQTCSLDFASEARNGNLMKLDELVKNFAPDIMKELPEFLMGFGKVDKTLYQIPNYQMMVSLFSLRAPNEYASKYMDVERLKNVIAKSEYSSEFYDVLEQYLENIKKASKIDLGFNTNFVSLYSRSKYEMFYDGYGIIEKGGRYTVKNLYTLPEYKDTYDRMAKWYQKGYIRKDILSAKANEDDGKIGGSSLYIGNGYTGEEVKKNGKGQEEKIIYLYDSYYVPSKNNAGGNAIVTGCKNPETAIKLIEAMNTKKGKDIYNFLTYGMEGTHYTKEGSDRIRTIGYEGSSTSSAKYGLWKWVLGNTENAYLTQIDPDNMKEFVFKEMNQGKKTKYSKLIGFYPDVTKIETKLAQIQTIVKELNNPLCSGALDNHEKIYGEFMKKLNEAGNKEIEEEFQKQIDEFMKNK